MSHLSLVATRKEVAKAEKIKKDFGIKNNSDLIRKLLFSCPSKNLLISLYENNIDPEEIKKHAHNSLFILSGVNVFEEIKEEKEKEENKHDVW